MTVEVVDTTEPEFTFHWEGEPIPAPDSPAYKAAVELIRSSFHLDRVECIGESLSQYYKVRLVFYPEATIGSAIQLRFDFIKNQPQSLSIKKVCPLRGGDYPCGHLVLSNYFSYKLIEGMDGNEVFETLSSKLHTALFDIMPRRGLNSLEIAVYENLVWTIIATYNEIFDVSILEPGFPELIEQRMAVVTDALRLR